MSHCSGPCQSHHTQSHQQFNHTHLKSHTWSYRSYSLSHCLSYSVSHCSGPCQSYHSHHLKSQVPSLKSHTITYLVTPFILFESLFRSLSVLVIPFILRESLFWSLSALVIPFILCESLSVPVTVSRVSSPPPGHSMADLRSQPSGHSLVMVIRSWSCGHESKVIPHTSNISVSVLHSISNKERNSLIKQTNGNGKNTLSISHWNLGSKLWKNKRNLIQALVDQANPDILFISEANLDNVTPPHESLISGYNITRPKTVTRNGTARLILLTKENIEFKLRDDLMDDIFTSIWIKISRPGSKGLLICGLYREHQYLSQDTDWSLQPIEQNRRWAHFLRQVETARLSEHLSHHWRCQLGLHEVGRS